MHKTLPLLARTDFPPLRRRHFESFRAENLGTVMCNALLSVDWQGDLYDCDFNQMLGLPARLNGAARPHLRDLLAHSPVGEAIRVADHCYGCTAGQGSSCGGALEAKAA